MSNHNFNSDNQNINSDRQFDLTSDFGKQSLSNNYSGVLMNNTKRAEEKILQGIEAEKNGNLKQAIVYYRQALKYLPESLEGRQLLTTALMKVRDRHQIEITEKKEREDNNLKSAVALKNGHANYLKNDLETNESNSIIPVENATPILETNFTNLGLVGSAAFNNSSIELVPQQADKFVFLPTINETAEAPQSEEMLAADVYVAQALAYFEQKQWDKSIAACQEALRVYPKMGSAYKVWGNCLQRAGKITEAIGIYAKALEVKADMAEIYCNLGSIYAKQRKWHQAVEHYQKSIIINPDNAIPYRNLAKVWDELEEYDKSAECFFQAIDIQPNLLSAENHFSLANNLIAEGNIVRAIASYKSCVELKPEFLNAYARLADALEEDGQSEAALFYYKKLARLQTEKNIASTERSKSSRQIGYFLKPKSLRTLALSSANEIKVLPSASQDVVSVKQLQPAQQTNEERISAYLQAAAKQPNSASIKFKLGDIYAEDREWLKAVDCYQQAIAITPKKAQYHLKLARIWQKLNEPDKANLAFYVASSLEPQKVSAKNHYLLGEKLLQQKQTERAIDCYRRAVSLKPDLIEAYWRLGEISLVRGNHKTALACYHRALKIEPKRVQNYILLGKALSQHNNWEAALSYYQKALILKPNNADIYINIGECLVNLQRYEEAAKTLQQGIGKDFNNWQLYYQLGNACSQQNLWQEAVGAYEKAVMFNADGLSVLHHHLGQAYLELQNWQNAVGAFEKAIGLDSAHSWSYYGLGDALSKLEQWQGAASAFARSLELNPDFDWAYHKLGNVNAELQDWDGAVAAYRQALAITPDLPKTEDKLNDVLRKRSMSDLERVSQYYQTSLEREPESESAYFKALEVSPSDPAIYTKLAKLYQSQGNSAQAIAFYKIALQLQPDRSEASSALQDLQSKSR